MTRTQNGGIKVLFHQTDRHVMDREIRSLDGITTILTNTTNIEVVSTDSLYSFVLRLHLNKDPAKILFRSNILDTKTSRFTRESFSKTSIFSKQSVSLAPDKAFNNTDGLPIHEIIMKISIINPGEDSRGIHIRPRMDVKLFKLKKKASLSNDEFSNEYYTQRYLYSSMMSISGNPFCPDAFGLYVTRSPEDGILLSSFQKFQNIVDMAATNPELKDIMKYLRTHVDANYRIGVIFMESIPASYKAVYYLSLNTQPNYDENVYKKICEGICAIDILTIYRGKFFHLDAHRNNWLCDPTKKLTEQVKELDFGRVYRITDLTKQNDFITELKKNIKQYFENLSKYPDFIISSLNIFFYTMGAAVDPELTQYINEPNIQRKIEIQRKMNIELKIMLAASLLEDEIRRMIVNFNENEYFSKPYMSLLEEEKKMNIKMIHRIILIHIYVDFFYNCSMYRANQGQIAHIYNIIFQTTTLNIESLSGLHIDLDEYGRANHDKANMLLEAYKRIYTILYKFNEDKHYGNIRDYKRFKEYHYTNGQRALTKIKQLAGIFMQCSLTKASFRGFSKCSSAVCGVVSTASSGVARASLGLARGFVNASLGAVKYAFDTARSSIGYPPPPPPDITVSKERAESPKGSVDSVPPIYTLAYGGSRHTKRVMHRKRHTRHARRTRRNYTKKR
jgi:hypothetical protein